MILVVYLGSCSAQVPCFSHSCFQKLNSSPPTLTSVHLDLSSGRRGRIFSGSNLSVRLQKRGPILWLLVGQIPWIVHSRAESGK